MPIRCAWSGLFGALVVTGAILGCGKGGNAARGNESGDEDASGAAEGGRPKDGDTPVAPLTFADIGGPVAISNEFYRTEGPVWDPAKRALYFTDISVETGGAIYQLALPSTITVLLAPDGNANGLGLDPDGTLIGAGHAAGNVWRLSRGTMRTLAPCAPRANATCFEGTPLNAPNDLTARSDGTIYFTDPNFASSIEGFADEDRPLAKAEGVYRLAPDGTLHLEDKSTVGPNGVSLSPDQRTLYVSYTLDTTVVQFDVAEDGSLNHKRPFVSGVSIADGMCVDSDGNVYVGNVAGLSVFSAGGDALGTIKPPRAAVTNCAFGGDDQRTLFITSHASFVAAPGDASLYRIDSMPVPGIPQRN